MWNYRTYMIGSELMLHPKEGRPVPGWVGLRERTSETTLPDRLVVKIRSVPARVPVRIITPSKCTSHFGIGLGQLADLELLGLGGNQLSGEIPSEFADFANLSGLWFDNNHPEGIASELGDLASLRNLHLQYNRLRGWVLPSPRDTE